MNVPDTQLKNTHGGPLAVTDTLYRHIARGLAETVGGHEFFNGSIEHDTDEFYSRLTATLIIYRSAGRVTDIVPVWWEFHLEQPGGEVLTDFCWQRFLEFLDFSRM